MDKTNTVKELNKTNTVKELNNTVKELSENNGALNNESTYVKLPKWLKDSRCVINPINDKKGNNKCFDHSITLCKHNEMGTNYNRINEIELFLKNFNFKNINYPLEKEAYETFEKNNESVALNILKSDDENKKVSYLFKSRNKRK